MTSLTTRGKPVARSETNAFIDALKQAEEALDPTPLVGMFAERATLENAPRAVTRSGAGGAKQFWQDYLSAFDRVRSEFTHVLEGPSSATLEWRSDGTLANSGQPISYRGTSILEFANGKVARFATYYDSAAFLPQGSKHA
jgi:ketosteroid isomerase-like protein